MPADERPKMPENRPNNVKGSERADNEEDRALMKFGKWLRLVTEQMMPGWQESFVAYKDLKRQINHIAAIQQQPGSGQRSNIPAAVIAEEMRFVMLLYGEISKLNVFFMEELEFLVIRFQVLRDEVAGRRTDLLRIWRGLVCLHGEMILLENYSSLNCLGLVKIVKKHDKLSNSVSLLRFPFVQRLLRQPFFETEQLILLVAACVQLLAEVETLLQSVEREDNAADPDNFVEGNEDPHDEHNGTILRSTVTALRMIQHLRNGSSTYGPSSLRYG